MGQPFLGEIRLFAGIFAPAGWAFCDGQALAISENEALFQLIGTTYGGDGEQTFNLPDLRGRVPIHLGTGPGLTTRIIGESGGIETVTLTPAQIPAHSHAVQATAEPGSSSNPAGAIPGNSQGVLPYIEDPPGVSMAASAIGPVGGSQSHENMQPYLCINFIMSLFGVFPPRS